MKDQLTQYVNLLFAGAPDAEDIKQEILQNTLDRYDDLIAQGKAPEAAYRLAISGIGDINEILGNPQPLPHTEIRSAIYEEAPDTQSKKMKAVAVAMYILCPVPLFILSEFGLETLGLSMLLLLVAAATALIIMAGKHEPEEAEQDIPESPKSKLCKSIDTLIGVMTLAVYLIVSFATKAWFITWLIFPVSGCIKGLIRAILDLKEAIDNET